MMSKQSAIILILVVFLGALGALIYFYFTFNTTNGPQLPPVTNNNLDVYDPFGTRLVDSTPASSTEIIENNPDYNAPTFSTDKLRKIFEEPVASFSTIDKTDTNSAGVRYILRSNGNIYEAYVDSTELKRMSIITIPKVYDSLWLADGEKVIIRYLKDESENIDTFYIWLNPATTTLNEFEGGINGNHLPENINSIAMNPAGTKLFFLTHNLTGSSGYLSTPDGLSKTLIFQSPMNEWLISWPKEQIITLTTKPSAKVSGFLYFLNNQTKNFSRIIGNINGLTTKTNKTATEVLYSDSSQSLLKLYVLNVQTGESKLLPVSTLPEKCLWSNTDDKIIYCAVPKTFPVGDYPDIWYQGLATFTDSLWMINTNTMASTLVLDIKTDTANDLDIINPQLDNNDNYLFFINKKDLSLWNLKLK